MREIAKKDMLMLHRFARRVALTALCPAVLAIGQTALSPSPATAAKAAKPAGHVRPPAKAVGQPGIRIVACDQHVQSRKRGVAANRLDAADFQALAPGVSWYYNWNFEPGTTGTPPAGVPVSFVPMAWGDSPGSLSGLRAYLASGHKPRQVLAINEPNLRGQAFITPAQAADLYGRVKAVTDQYHVPLAGPQMAIGSPAGDSIQAQDPIENKELTYTFMVPYLKAFFFYADRAKIDVAGVGIHPYNDGWGLIGLADLTHRDFNRPLWVTEFNPSNDSLSDRDMLAYMIQVTDYMERSPFVAGYAFFKERIAGHPKGSLLADAPGQLTPWGAAYVNLPVHDADVYYRIPGRLQAENYVALDRMDIQPTQDSDGLADMVSGDAGATLDYHLQVDQAGTYQLRFRVTGAPGTVSVLKGDTVLTTASVGADQDGWQTVGATVRLPAGAQTLRVRCAAKGQRLNWVEYSKA